LEEPYSFAILCASYGQYEFTKVRGWPAGRQYIGDLPNSDLRQMMMTVDTNFWGAPGYCLVVIIFHAA